MVFRFVNRKSVEKARIVSVISLSRRSNQKKSLEESHILIEQLNYGPVSQGTIDSAHLITHSEPENGSRVVKQTMNNYWIF